MPKLFQPHFTSFLKVLFFSLSFSFANADDALISKLTHEDIKGLPTPEISQSVSIYNYDVKMENMDAYIHLQQGFGHLVGMWDLQSYRHFLQAVTLEPESLLATVGLSLSLMSIDGHVLPQNQIALGRVESLLEKEVGTEFEKGFAQAVVMLAKGDGKGCWKKLTELTKSQYDGWMIPALLNANFSRDGYTVLGEPKYNQRKAVEILTSYSSESPDDPGPLTFFVTSQVDNPDTRAVYYTDILPCARKLARLYPDYPYYHLLQGYCEMRCGDPFSGLESYRKAESLYDAYRKKHALPWRNCKSLIDSKIGIISCLILQENFDEARKISQELISIKLPKRKYTTSVEAAKMWEAQSFPIRIACMEQDYEKMKKEAAVLKALVDKVPEAERRLHHHFWQSLQYYVYVRSALNKGALEEAHLNMNRFLLSSEKILLGANKAIIENETQYWSRARGLLTVLENELKTRHELAQPSPARTNVMTWVANAIDKQEFSRDLMPPLWLYPMESIKGEYLYANGEFKEALEEYDKAYNRMPNHIPTTKGIQKCLMKLNKPEKANQIRAMIDKLQSREE